MLNKIFLLAASVAASVLASAQAPTLTHSYVSPIQAYYWESPAQTATSDNQSVHIVCTFQLPQQVTGSQDNTPPWNDPFTPWTGTYSKDVPVDVYGTVPSAGMAYWATLKSKARDGQEIWVIHDANPHAVSRDYLWYTPGGSYVEVSP